MLRSARFSSLITTGHPIAHSHNVAIFEGEENIFPKLLSFDTETKEAVFYTFDASGKPVTRPDGYVCVTRVIPDAVIKFRI